MSTFKGDIKEIPNIRVDNFENTEYKCYFLSHCHSDHMLGLRNLSEISTPLYTTNLSKQIIKKLYPSINVQILEYGSIKNIEFHDNDGNLVKFNVTALNAGHCLGACMLLFQIEGLDILYTGDFRISMEHVKNIKILKEIKNYKNLSLYVDTTFLNDSFQHFPSQKESCSKVIELIKNHLDSSSNHKVCLQTPARFGYERLFIEIDEKLKEKIFIYEQEVRELYSTLSNLTTLISTDKLKANIFLKPSYLSERDHTSDDNTLTIKLSAMYWSKWISQKPFHCEIEKNEIRVCYATHNSYSELKDFIEWLEPKKIMPTVIPNNFIQRELMMSKVREMTSKFSSDIQVGQEGRKKFGFKRLRSFICDKDDVEQKTAKLMKK